jgi:class I fructose-bisphosphate aldolase
MENIDQFLELLGHKKNFLLNHVCRTITKDQIHLPLPDFTNSFSQSNRNGQTIKGLSQLYNHGRVAEQGTSRFYR